MESNFLNSQPDLKEIIDLDMNVEIEKNRRISTYDSFSIDKIMELYKSSCLVRHGNLFQFKKNESWLLEEVERKDEKEI